MARLAALTITISISMIIILVIISVIIAIIIVIIVIIMIVISYYYYYCYYYCHRGSGWRVQQRIYSAVVRTCECFAEQGTGGVPGVLQGCLECRSTCGSSSRSLGLARADVEFSASGGGKNCHKLAPSHGVAGLARALGATSTASRLKGEAACRVQGEAVVCKTGA